MSRTVYCLKLKKELPALDAVPYPGEMGDNIFKSISAEAWQLWLARQTMLINEYRLSLIDPEARKMLEKEMAAFLFEAKDDTVPGYVPPTD